MNLSTKKSGEFFFSLKGEKKFDGYYKINGRENGWKGLKFENEFSHIISCEGSPNGKIGFRARNLTKTEYEQINAKSGQLHNNTLIGEIANGTPVKLLNEYENSFKIAVIHDNELRIGYIAKRYNSKETILPQAW